MIMGLTQKKAGKKSINECIILTESDLRNIIVKGVHKLMEAYGDPGNESRPAIYVGTYGKYNSGSIAGGWVYLDEFDSKADFLRYCTQQLHADERDAELMFQDYENIPVGFVSEYHISDEFWDFLALDGDYDMKLAIANAIGNPQDAMSVLENGDYRLFPGCDSVEDIVYEYLDEGVMQTNPENYFDYERFGRECSWDGPMSDDYESIYEEFGVDEDDDQALGEAIVESMYGGVENMPKETVEQYMDIRALARDMNIENTYVDYDGGMIELY